MSTSSPTISTETARHVLWTFGYTGGYQPGTYHQKLLDLLAYAPPGELAKLGQIYPGEAEAVRIAKYDENGIVKLTALASGKPIRCTRCKDEDGPFVPSGLCEACAAPMPLDGVA